MDRGAYVDNAHSFFFFFLISPEKFVAMPTETIMVHIVDIHLVLPRVAFV